VEKWGLVDFYLNEMYMVRNGWGSEGETGDWSGHPVSVSHPFECEMAYGDTCQGK